MADKVITGATYVSLATNFGQLVSVLKNSTSYMYNALTTVAELDSVEATRDLIIPFDNVYQQQFGALNASAQYLEVVRALNNHVLNRARDVNGDVYTDINDWFDDESVNTATIPQTWKDMCDLTGVEIV